MTPLSFLVVDDERLGKDYIQDLIFEYMPDATVYEASSVEAALPIVELEKPDVVFLDISMPEADGFTLLEESSNRDFELVFISAFNQYAMKALKAGACDYLLKPVRKDDFKETFFRTIDRRLKELERRRLVASNVDSSLDEKLVVNQQVGFQAFRLRDIVYLDADNTYTTLHTADGRKVVSSKPIHYFEETLDPKWFFRVHKSHIINLYHFKEYNATGKQAMMKNGDKITVSRYRLKELLNRILDQP